MVDPLTKNSSSTGAFRHQKAVQKGRFSLVGRKIATQPSLMRKGIPQIGSSLIMLSSPHQTCLQC